MLPKGIFPNVANRYILNPFLKGQCHEIFDFWFFSLISLPQAPECTIRTVSNFFENSRRYLQLNVCHRCRWHRWQMQKIFNQKSFNYLVWTPLGSRVNLQIHFCLQVHFKVSAALYCSHYLPLVSFTPVANLPPVSLIPAANCHRCRWYRRQIAAGVVDTGGKFSTGINNTRETGGKICRRCRWRVANLDLRISPRIFEKI